MSLFNKVYILLIEDEPSTVRLIEETLKDKPEGWDVAYDLRNVSRLSSAKQMLRSVPFDLIILDVGLPNGEGISSLQRVLDMADDIPVIVFTGSIDPADIDAFTRLGAYRAYNKSDFDPHCMTIFHYTIANVLREHRKDQRLNLLMGAMLGELRKLITECSNCHKLRQPVTEEFLPLNLFLESFGIFITSGMCGECQGRLYGHLGPSSESSESDAGKGE